jgi:homoserine kinase
MAAAAAAAFFDATGVRPFGFKYSVDGDVPTARGLGSSVTVRLGILHGLNELSDRPLDRHRIYVLCAELEGHPDNAAPGSFGGFTVVPPQAPVQRFAVDHTLSFVLLIPNFEIQTEMARQVLPGSVPLRDAVSNIANAAAISTAFAARDYVKLEGCFDDRLHQPYRAELLPCLNDVLEAGRDAGALGGWLSGSGSTIACVTLARPEKIAVAMHAASGLQDAAMRIVAADNTGVRILR